MDITQNITNGAAALRPDNTDATSETVLKSYAEYTKAVQAELAHQVAVARSMGLTWQQVGDALGISRQAAHERFGGKGMA